MSSYTERRKRRLLEVANQHAAARLEWKQKSRYFHRLDYQALSFLIPEGSSVLDLGCGPGDLLASLNPGRGVGMDFSPDMIRVARQRYPELEFHQADVECADSYPGLGEPFDFIILSDTIGWLNDCQATLALLHRVCTTHTRVIIVYYSYLWEPLLRIAELLRLKMPQGELNYLTSEDIQNFLDLTDYQVVRRDWRVLLPLRIGFIGPLLNRFIATLPVIRRFTLRNYLVARSLRHLGLEEESCSVIVPCRNEQGNIEPLVSRMPRLCGRLEIVFVEGHSRDATLEEIRRVQQQYPDLNIKLFRQPGVGKADATFTGLDHATGEVLMILDADLTVSPEDLEKFWQAIHSGKGEYINGSRLIYPMEGQAMRYLNYVANRIFSILFTWMLNQRYTDTLCGTKVLKRSDYERMNRNREYFADLDPFGDFFLIFGSAKLGLKLIEIPVSYRARQYGDTQISRFRHGLQLLRTVYYAYFKLKAY